MPAFRLYDYLLGKQTTPYNAFIEKYSSFEKRSSFFYINELSKKNTDIYRLLKRSRKRIPKGGKIKFINFNVPRELKNIYPIGQKEIPYDIEKKNKKANMRCGFFSLCEFEDAKARLCYQYGKNVASFFNIKKREIKIIISKTKIRRLKEIKINSKSAGVFGARTGYFIPSFYGAIQLRKYMPKKDYCVIIKKEVVSFAKKGRNVFAKYVKYCNYKIRPHDYVFVVDEKFNLIALGQALMNKREMNEFSFGVAVRIRKTKE